MVVVSSHSGTSSATNVNVERLHFSFRVDFHHRPMSRVGKLFYKVQILNILGLEDHLISKLFISSIVKCQSYHRQYIGQTRMSWSYQPEVCANTLVADPLAPVKPSDDCCLLR